MQAWTLKVGYGLTTIIDPEQGGTLLTEIKELRQKLFTQTGYELPDIYISDEATLAAHHYQIRINDKLVAQQELSGDNPIQSLVASLEAIVIDFK
jgi:flagellar biosynthesis protein FlhA